MNRKEERRAQLAKAAEDMKSTGKAESAFDDSGYAVGEGESASCGTALYAKTVFALRPLHFSSAMYLRCFE